MPDHLLDHARSVQAFIYSDGSCLPVRYEGNATDEPVYNDYDAFRNRVVQAALLGCASRVRLYVNYHKGSTSRLIRRSACRSVKRRHLNHHLFDVGTPFDFASKLNNSLRSLRTRY
jgi:hypothetical protein